MRIYLLLVLMVVFCLAGNALADNDVQVTTYATVTGLDDATELEIDDYVVNTDPLDLWTIESFDSPYMGFFDGDEDGDALGLLVNSSTGTIKFWDISGYNTFMYLRSSSSEGTTMTFTFVDPNCSDCKATVSHVWIKVGAIGFTSGDLSVALYDINDNELDSFLLSPSATGFVSREDETAASLIHKIVFTNEDTCNWVYGGTNSEDLIYGGIVATNRLTGDYNYDGTVDGADYSTWADQFGDDVMPGTGADGNRDGHVDQADFSVWADNYGNSL
jgi:hypothetical protein